MVNPDGKIWIDRIGEGRSWTGELLAAADADRILRLLADHAGEVVTRDRPRVSATLPETGERFQGAFMPVVARPAFAIRKRPEVVFTLDDYVERRHDDRRPGRDHPGRGEARENLLIVGGTGSGKTTLANAILAEPAFAADRVVLIEDTAELQCSAADQIQMLTKRTEPAVTMTDLVRDTLRLRPDRIVIGEVRDGSALDLLKAWNTGHPGGLATLHANSAAEGLTPAGGPDRRGDPAHSASGDRPGHQPGDPHRAHAGRAAGVGDHAGCGLGRGRLRAAGRLGPV